MKSNMGLPGDRLRSNYYEKLKHAETQSASVSEDFKRRSGSMLVTSASSIAPTTPLKSVVHTSDDSPVVGEGEKLASTFEDPSAEGFSLNYIEKAGLDIRMKFLHSLVMKGVLVPASMKPKTHQTSICIVHRGSHHIRLGRHLAVHIVPQPDGRRRVFACHHRTHQKLPEGA